MNTPLLTDAGEHATADRHALPGCGQPTEVCATRPARVYTNPAKLCPRQEKRNWINEPPDYDMTSTNVALRKCTENGVSGTIHLPGSFLRTRNIAGARGGLFRARGCGRRASGSACLAAARLVPYNKDISGTARLLTWQAGW